MRGEKEDDLISRQAAINKINERQRKLIYCFGFENDMVKIMDIAKSIITAIPPAQPEQIWILCDEKMPEEHEWIGTKKFGTTISDEVYVTFESEKGERFCKHMTFQNGELSRYDKTYMDAWYKDCKPIAWMPLPEPYAGKRTKETDYDYERAVEQLEHDILYEPTFNQNDGSM